MGKIVRYEFVGNRRVLALLLILLFISALITATLASAVLASLIVYLLLTVAKIEEEIDHPNEFIAGFKEDRYRK